MFRFSCISPETPELQKVYSQLFVSRVFKSPSPTAFPGIGDSPIPGDGESPPIKQILEKKIQN